MNRGDVVQLKVPEQGRRFIGKILKEVNGSLQVGLPNGLYVIRPKELWEICEKSVSVSVDENFTDSPTQDT